MSEHKIKIFAGRDVNKLEQEVNEFMKTVTVLDVCTESVTDYDRESSFITNPLRFSGGKIPILRGYHIIVHYELAESKVST